MISAIKVAIFLWPLLLVTSSVLSRSFVTKVSSEKHIYKRDVGAIETNNTKPNIYSFDITSNITYRYAVTTVSSRVANPANTSKEISFHVTLPDSAFISRFFMVIQDKVYEAYVKEKEEAKKVYEEAVHRGSTAGLVSMNARDSNIFDVSVNVEGNNKVTFNLVYEQLLTRTLGQYENIINVNPGQVVKSFSITVNIQESSSITKLEVPDLRTSNEIDTNKTKDIDAKIDRPTNESAKITWSPDSQQQMEMSADGVAGQFIVRYDVDHSSHPNQILVDEGYFVHFYAPTNLKTLPKHVIFVLDISGSMGGRKIEQLRESLKLILADIGPSDYFSIILFSDSVQLWTLKGTVGEVSAFYNRHEQSTSKSEIEVNEQFIIPATSENIQKATNFAKSLQETGSTNIIAAIRKALEVAKWGQKQPTIKAKPLIIFLTDGQPNVEMSDPEEINKSVNKLNPDKYPIFSLGFGDGADYEFLRKLSLSNGGFARNIYVASDTTLQLKNFYKEVASPLLSNVTFEYVPGQVSEGYVTKTVFNNLYNGSELVVAGKLSDNTTELKGNMTYEALDGFFCVPLPSPIDIPVKKTQGHLEKLWAYLYIKELLDKDLISDEKNSTYKQKALKLSLEYGFVTPLTSLVVVKPNETDSGVSLKKSHTLAEESPSYLAGPVPMMMNSPVYISAYAAPPSFTNRHFTFGKKSNLITGWGKMANFRPGTSQYMSMDSIEFKDSIQSASKFAPRRPVSMKHSFRHSRNSSQYYHASQRHTAKSQYTGHSIQSEDDPGIDFSIVLRAPDDNIMLTTEPPMPLSTTLGLHSLGITETKSTNVPTPLDANVIGFSVPYNVSNIAWLQNKTEIKFPNSKNSYSVFMGDLPNIEYQSCKIPNSNDTIGHCRHLAHCIIPQILSSFSDFIPYGEQCIIDARFIGICCPKTFASQKLDSSTEPANTTLPTLMPLLSTTV